MKKKYTLFVLVVYMLVSPISAQDTAEEFFKNQGKKDALYEQTLTFKSEEDAFDYWEDQRLYEQQLSELNPEAYQYYITAKQEVYVAHQVSCETTDCNHNRYYLLQAALYTSGKQSEQLVFQKKKRRLKKKRD